MRNTLTLIAIISMGTIAVGTASAQSAKDVRGSSPLIAIANEAPPKLIVDAPLAEPLAQGRVFISVPHREPATVAGVRPGSAECFTSPRSRAYYRRRHLLAFC